MSTATELAAGDRITTHTHARRHTRSQRRLPDIGWRLLEHARAADTLRHERSGDRAGSHLRAPRVLDPLPCTRPRVGCARAPALLQNRARCRARFSSTTRSDCTIMRCGGVPRTLPSGLVIEMPASRAQHPAQLGEIETGAVGAERLALRRGRPALRRGRGRGGGGGRPHRARARAGARARRARARAGAPCRRARAASGVRPRRRAGRRSRGSGCTSRRARRRRRPRAPR